MSSVEVDPITAYKADFDRNRQTKTDPIWLATLRQKGMIHFEQVGFPTSRQEEWKYTRVTPIQKRRFQLANAETLDQTTVQDFLIPALPCYQLVFVNGHYAPDLSNTDAIPNGVQLHSLATQLKNEPATLEADLGRFADIQTQSFTALNTAFLEGGASLRLRRGTVLQKPLHLLYLSTGKEPAQMAHPRNLIVLEAQSQATVIEHYAGLGEAPYWQNVVSEVCLEEGAQLEHCRLQQETANAYHIATMNVVQQRDSRFISHVHTLGGALTRNGLQVVLAAEGAECTLNGLYITKGREHVDNQTQVDHTKPHGSSEEVYRGVLDDRSRAVFSGKVQVHKNAQKTAAHQDNRNLLLSRHAEIDTKPQLEIYADDVKCSHGATVGQLDENEVFYLRSRGIEEKAARDLLVFAFANEVIQRISLSPLADYIRERLTARLARDSS